MTEGPQPIPLRCPRCAADVLPEQDWCLRCGAAARTRLAPTPNWKLPVAILATIALLAGLALAIAFAELTDDDGPLTQASTATAPGEPEAATATTDTVPTAPPATATAPVVTTPPAVTTAPTATTPPTAPGTPTVPTTTTPGATTPTVPGSTTP